MFGYVLPRKDKLSEENMKRYRAAYCGLCRSLSREYGFKARFLVNYDMVFLYFLRHEGGAAPVEKCFCPAHPFCRKTCLQQDEAMRYAADFSVLLACWKLQDSRNDGGFFRKLGAGFLLRLYKGCYRKAAARQAKANAVFARELSRLHELEKEKCPSIDRTADAFAKLLTACAGEGENARIYELLLYHIGRYLYLADALEDLPKDIKKGNYNPLQYRYSLENGNLCPEDKKQLVSSIDASVSMAASAFELLPAGADREILENIIYYGLPAVLHSVEKGVFRKRGKQA